MNILSKAKIRGIGGCLPEKIITNDDLSKVVETSDEWITTRTGIKERRKASETEGCVYLAYGAVNDLKDQGYRVDDVDLIIVATMSPDHYTPSVSAQLQGKLGLGVYNFAIKTVPAGMNDLINSTDFNIADLDWFIPHSANLRMIQFIAKILKFPMDKVLESVTSYGNTSAATIPLALWRGKQEGKLKSGDLIATYGFGGGLNHAGAIFKWFE